MEIKYYTIRLQTRAGVVTIENVLEFVFAKRFMYYSTKDDQVRRISRKDIKSAQRLINGSDKWVEIRIKNFEKT